MGLNDSHFDFVGTIIGVSSSRNGIGYTVKSPACGIVPAADENFELRAKDLTLMSASDESYEPLRYLRSIKFNSMATRIQRLYRHRYRHRRKIMATRIQRLYRHWRSKSMIHRCRMIDNVVFALEHLWAHHEMLEAHRTAGEIWDSLEKWKLPKPVLADGHDGSNFFVAFFLSKIKTDREKAYQLEKRQHKRTTAKNLHEIWLERCNGPPDHWVKLIRIKRRGHLKNVTDRLARMKKVLVNTHSTQKSKSSSSPTGAAQPPIKKTKTTSTKNSGHNGHSDDDNDDDDDRDDKKRKKPPPSNQPPRPSRRSRRNVFDIGQLVIVNHRPGVVVAVKSTNKGPQYSVQMQFLCSTASFTNQSNERFFHPITTTKAKAMNTTEIVDEISNRQCRNIPTASTAARSKFLLELYTAELPLKVLQRELNTKREAKAALEADMSDGEKELNVVSKALDTFNDLMKEITVLKTKSVGLIDQLNRFYANHGCDFVCDLNYVVPSSLIPSLVTFDPTTSAVSHVYWYWF